MKNFKSLLMAMIIITAIIMASCKDNKTETKAEETTEKQGKEYTSAYVCPMHCEDSGSDKGGKCDTCGMTLVKKEDHTENGHKHK